MPFSRPVSTSAPRTALFAFVHSKIGAGRRYTARFVATGNVHESAEARRWAVSKSPGTPRMSYLFLVQIVSLPWGRHSSHWLPSQVDVTLLLPQLLRDTATSLGRFEVRCAGKSASASAVKQ